MKTGLDQHEWPAAPAPVASPDDNRRRGSAEDQIDLGRLWTMLARRWRLLLALVTLGTTVTAALVMLSPLVYEAAVTLVVPGSNSNPSSNANAVRTVLTSSSVLDGVNKALESEQFRSVLSAESILVDPIGGTDLVRLRVRTADAAAAPKAAALLAERGAAAAREMRDKALRTARPALDTDVEEASKRLEGSEQRLLDFRREAQIEVLRAQVERQLAARRAAATIDSDLQRERARYKAAMDEMERLRTRPDPALQEQHAAMMTSLARIAAESRTTITALETSRKQATSEAGSGEMKSLDQLYQRELELKRLERQVQLAEQVYAAELVRGRQAEVVQAVPLIELADTAIGSASPVGRDLPRKIALGLVLSLLMAAGLVVVLEGARS